MNNKIIFILPPSEGKKSENKFNLEELSFNFEKPLKISENVSEKDLKCSWKRFEEGLELNKKISSHQLSPEWELAFLDSISRYSGVMFSAIDYENMTYNWKTFFEENFLIFSWMYWIVKPLDKIGNYKLPIESKWLLDFRWTKVLEKINELKPDFVVNLLPISYSKLIFWKNKKQGKVFNNLRKFKIININFIKPDWKKISHWVKKIKWEWINNICEKSSLSTGCFSSLQDFGWKIIKKENNIVDINIII